MTGTWSYAGTRCKIKPGWEGAGREGQAISYFDESFGQVWIAVHWDDEDDPDCFKATGLLIKRKPWQPDSEWEEANQHD